MPERQHDEEMYEKHGQGLTKDQHLVVYAQAWQYGHSAGEYEVETYYSDLAEFARNLLDAD